MAECISLLYICQLYPLTPLLQFVLDLSYKLFLHCYAVVSKNLTCTSRHMVSLAELLFVICDCLNIYNGYAMF